MTSNKPCISFHVGSISSLLFSLDTCLLSQYHTPHILFISLKEFNKGIQFMFFSVHQSVIYYSYKKCFPQCIHIGPHYDFFYNIAFDIQSPFLPSSYVNFLFMNITQQQFTCQFDLQLKKLFSPLLENSKYFSIVHFVCHVLQKNPLVPKFYLNVLLCIHSKNSYFRFTTLSKMEGTHLALM